MVEEDIGRNRAHLEQRTDSSPVERLRPLHLVLLDIALPRLLVTIAADTEDRERLGRVLLLQSQETRRGGKAWGAPRGPEVDEHDTASEILQRDAFPLNRVDRELGGEE